MEHANPNHRSLLCFEEPMPNCSRQRLLKVLSVRGRKDLVDYKCLHGLNQLRYCEFGGRLTSTVTRRSFESFIVGLKSAKTLDFSQLWGYDNLPDDIWNVKTLRHVILNTPTECCNRSSGPSSFANLINLQTLEGVKSRESWNAQLPILPNVRDLDIYVENLFSWNLTAKLLDTLNHLTSLKLLGNEVPQKIVMERFSFYRHLQSLYLSKSLNLNNKLSPVVGMFPIHITKIELVDLQFKEDLFPVLEKLRCLRELALFKEKVNRKMSCSAGGFQQLHDLWFHSLDNLEEWEIKAGAMPILQIVRLYRCDKLRVPLGLQYLSNLKTIQVIGCIELADHKDEIRDDICKHVPQIAF